MAEIRANCGNFTETDEEVSTDLNGNQPATIRIAYYTYDLVLYAKDQLSDLDVSDTYASVMIRLVVKNSQPYKKSVFIFDSLHPLSQQERIYQQHVDQKIYIQLN